MFIQVGFEMLDAIALAEGISMQTIQHKALIGKGISFEETIVHPFPESGALVIACILWGFLFKNCEHLSCGVELAQLYGVLSCAIDLFSVGFKFRRKQLTKVCGKLR